MKQFFLVVALLTMLSCYAQEEPIKTDRPTQTPSSSIMPSGRFLVETGVVREITTTELYTYSLPSVLLRYGINEFFEIRFQQDYIFADRVQGDESGFSSLKIGVKMRLADAEGWKPEMSFLGNVTTTTGQNTFKNQFVSSDFSFVFSNSLSQKLTLGYSIGLINGEFGFDTSLYTIVLSYSVIKQLTAYIEPYGFGIIDSGPVDHRINTGLMYLLKHNLQFDVSAGLGLSDTSPDNFFGIGIAFGF